MSLMANPAIIQNAGGLLNSASNYSFPLTSGLLSSIPTQSPQTPLPQGSLGFASPGVANQSAIALQMAGNPHAGPYAAVSVPSGLGVPGAGSSGGGSGSGLLGGLLGAAIQNPSTTKSLVNSATNAVSGLLGPSLTKLDTPLVTDPATLTGPTGDMNAAASTLPDVTGPSDATGPAVAAAGGAGLGAALGADAGAGAVAGGAGAAGAGAMGGAADTISGLIGGGSAAAPAASGAADAGAAAAGADAGSLGLLGSAGVVGLALAPALYGMSQPPVTVNSTWYNNFGNSVGAGLAPGATIQQKLQAATALQTLGSAGGDGADPTRLMQTLAPYGVTNMQQAQALANQLFNSIPAGAMPTANSHPMVHTA